MRHVARSPADKPLFGTSRSRPNFFLASLPRAAAVRLRSCKGFGRGPGQRLAASVVALAVGFALVGVAAAQGLQAQQTADSGLVEGGVARCVNGAEQPAGGVVVGVDGGAAVRSDSNGNFLLMLPPGMYTVNASAQDGVASRQYVSVDAGATIDIGNLDLGGGISGCGPDSDVTQPVLPTFTPTATAVPVQPTPTPQPSATPVPVPPAPADQPPADQPPADQPPAEPPESGG